MKLIDSNIIIYASKPGFHFLHSLLAEPDVAVSVITQVETLGYHLLAADEKLYLTEFFANVERLPVSQAVVEKAIVLRQTQKIKLGDALVAATALAHGATLVTRNTHDFTWMPGLTLLDPFARPSPR
ncbi:MAG: type II toxin-antitoxin system VapC family toxin [Verrucomicrobia bacterium]|nr:type II toxin-antitoxin system VapC family toxin [Verrucomicrobiota bacterium]